MCSGNNEGTAGKDKLTATIKESNETAWFHYYCTSNNDGWKLKQKQPSSVISAWARQKTTGHVNTILKEDGIKMQIHSNQDWYYSLELINWIPIVYKLNF